VATADDEEAWIARTRVLPGSIASLAAGLADADAFELDRRLRLAVRLEGDVERALLLRAGHSRAGHRCLFHPEQAQDPIPPEEQQMCAPDVDATQQLTWRVPYQVAMLFTAVAETLRRHRPSRGRASPSCAHLESCLSAEAG
jgi:hypothetical protein